MNERFPGYVKGVCDPPREVLLREFDGGQFHLEDAQLSAFRHLLGHTLRKSSQDVRRRFVSFPKDAKHMLLSIALGMAADDLTCLVDKGDCIVAEGSSPVAVGNPVLPDTYASLPMNDQLTLMGEYVSPQFVDYSRIYNSGGEQDSTNQREGGGVLLLHDVVVYHRATGRIVLEYPTALVPFDQRDIQLYKPVEVQ